MTPECDRMAERECSRLRRLDMTGTDERRNSCSCSGTPSSHQENSKMLIFYLICLNPLKLKLSKIRKKKERDWTYSS